MLTWLALGREELGVSKFAEEGAKELGVQGHGGFTVRPHLSLRQCGNGFWRWFAT